MRKISLFFILFVLTLPSIGCRVDKASQHSSTMDESTTPATEPQPAAPAPQTASTVTDTRPVIACFGDSLTAGLGTDPGQSYPDYLQSDLDARGYHYHVVNQGISGNTTKDGVDRINSVLARHPYLVIVEFGGNDGLRGLPIADSRANLDRIVSKLKSSSTKVILAGISLPPDYGPDYIKQFTDTYTLLAAKYRVPLLPFLLQNVYGVPGMMQRDRTHATAAGNKIVAANLLPLVQPLLKK